MISLSPKVRIFKRRGSKVEPRYLVILLVVGSIAFWFMKSIKRSRDKSVAIRMYGQKLGGTNSPQGFSDLNILLNDTKSAETELFDYVISDSALGKVVWKHRATKDDLAESYRKLLSSYCGWEQSSGHFVPVSAFMFPATLDYLLSKTLGGEASYDEMFECSYKLTEYFRNQKMGRVE